ncbi:lytic transglycosylase domain-containing protein [Sphingobium baderi]|uniref:Lytic transglycosylase n=1 Tax=Sphingobium baderi TaxID=1332080 RepID=A0A0S3EV40_9SPHN|nr:lytic transglycosylase [Sphingobium baderi]
MAALIRPFTPLLLALAIPSATFANSTPMVEHTSPAVERWRSFIAEASRRFGVPQAWIAAVMQAESRGRTHLHGRPITSSAGAMGLMQIMPGTWESLRRRHGLGPDPHDPRDNILAGTAYLGAMYDRFGYPGLFAAYNAGPGRYAEHLRTGRPLPGETRAYISQLAREPATSTMPPEILSGKRLFFALGMVSKSDPPATEAPPENPLFVTLEQSREDQK